MKISIRHNKIPVVVLPKQITEEEQINTELSNRINSEDTNSDYVKTSGRK